MENRLIKYNNFKKEQIKNKVNLIDRILYEEEKLSKKLSAYLNKVVSS